MTQGTGSWPQAPDLPAIVDIYFVCCRADVRGPKSPVAPLLVGLLSLARTTDLATLLFALHFD